MFDVVASLLVVLVSLVIHEVAHAVTADRLGDPTARFAGRISLDPRRHLDPVGTIILPLFLFLSTGSAFGYAKPVPVNRHVLGDRKFAVVALAGPASNILIAFVAALVMRVLYGAETVPAIINGFVNPGPGAKMLSYAVIINLFLAAFNIIPIPPLDGSRLIRPLLSSGGRRTLDRIEPYGFLILFAFIYLFDQPFFAIVRSIVGLFARVLPL